ncbi:hypothetical protein M5K25_000214 [Dendrobium thyrsiflorum]|uniref:Ribosomal RNA-processing protein 44 n=1 Tax=Dendrobium thyrsiflorum TaxID=117978 RepID=A0ABD0VTE4_DENTH
MRLFLCTAEIRRLPYLNHRHRSGAPSAIDNVVVLSQVLEDVSGRNMEVYYRIKSLCTNAKKNFFIFCNEHWMMLIRNRRLRKALMIELAEQSMLLLIVESYLRSLQQPNLLDLVAIPISLVILKVELNDLRLSNREVIYPEHKSTSDITSGLLHGFYHKGRFRVNRYSPFVGYIGSESIGDEIAIYDTRTEEKSLIVENVNGAFIYAIYHLLDEDDEDDVHMVPGNVNEAPRNANIAKACAGSKPTVSSRSFGRVIGIIKRNWSLSFPVQVLACLPPHPWSLSSEDLANPHREDLRYLRVFSVDQPGCKDIDDALHCSHLPNGNFEVGVCHHSRVALKHQPAPTKEMFEPLHRMVAAFGLDLDISSSKALIDSLDHVVGLDPDCKKLIKILATRCMTKAVYSWSGDMNPTEFHHYGLAAPFYTHFTSPMRRYAVQCNKQSSCTMHLANRTDEYVAFKVKTTNPKKYTVRPNTGIVLPGSTCDVLVTMQAQKEAPPDMQCKDKFLVLSVIAANGAIMKDITSEMFNKEPNKVVDELKLRVVYVPGSPPSPVPEETEEGSSPRSIELENEVRNSLNPTSRAQDESLKENTSEVSAMISKLTKEKTSADQQNQKLAMICTAALNSLTPVCMIALQHRDLAVSPCQDITSGLLHGFYHKGRFRVNRYSPLVGYVGSESIGDEIAIYDTVNMNRAFNGDIVVVELLPQCQRTEEKSLIVENVNGAFIYAIYHLLDEDDEDDVHMVPGNVDEAPRNANIAKACDGSTPTVSSRSFGRVIGIIKRNWSFYCGSLKPSSLSIENGGTPQALFISKDCRIPMICIQGGHLEKLLNKRIIVAVDSWDCSSRYPCGHHIRTIGEIGEREVENEVILIENDINSRAFPVQALACLPPHPWSLSSEDLANPHREDLRYLRVFSVDQPGCKDIDDALHCSLLPNGNFEVGVHIADVTNFVHPGTPLDKEAAQRGTSVYLVDKRIDMLPKLLTEDICSLRPGVERFSFSVILTMTPDAKIVSTRYTKSTIKSNAALSYVEAQARMDDSLMIDPLTTDLHNLNTLAKLMRQRRIERGALTFDSIEVKFQMDTETHDPLDIGIYQIREADQMIEEFMLACNFSVAEKILKHFPSCSLLRHQPAPTKEMFEPLHRMAAAFGLDLDISSSKALIDSLDHVVGLDPDCKKLIKILATRCMTKAVYSWSGDMNPTEFHHYGLAAPFYTHFTSPMRRYADIIVHRLLAAALEISKLPKNFLDSLRLTDIENNLNYRQINAKMANRASIYLHKVIYFKKRPMDIEARIIKIKPNGFVVFVPRFDIEGLICLTSRGSRGEEWILDEEHQRLSKKGTNISYCALQIVRIHLEVIVKPMLVHKVDKKDFYKSIVDALHHIPVRMQKKGKTTTCFIRECDVHIEEKLSREQSFTGHSMPSKEFQQLIFDTQELRNNQL